MNFSLQNIQALHHKYASSEKAFEIIYTHCQIVWEIAEQLIKKNSLNVSQEFVQVACLLHDIGSYKFIDSKGVLDEQRYICHGALGYDLLKNEGVEEALCRVAERHTGVGITKDEVVEEKLPIPPKDYCAETLEEKLVMYSDKFHSKTFNFNSFNWYQQYINKFGEHKVALFNELASQFGKPELESLSKKYNIPIR